MNVSALELVLRTTRGPEKGARANLVTETFICLLLVARPLQRQQNYARSPRPATVSGRHTGNPERALNERHCVGHFRAAGMSPRSLAHSPGANIARKFPYLARPGPTTCGLNAEELAPTRRRVKLPSISSIMLASILALRKFISLKL